MAQLWMIGLLAATAQPPVEPAAPAPGPVPTPIATPAPAPAPAPDAATGDAPPPVANTPAQVQGAKSYLPADFARFAPRTALNMLRAVPGFTIRGQSDQRGLGQATGNVILNGERFSGKSNDVVTELDRIAAGNVVRIDIVDGATLDVPGLSGQVANIITNATGVSGTFGYRPEIRTRRLPALLTRGQASVNGKIGRADYTVSIGNNGRRNGNHGPERVFTPDGTIIDRRDEDLRIIQENPTISARLHQANGDGSVWNINTSGQYFRSDLREISLRAGPGQPDRDRRLFEYIRQPSYEIGGDYEFPVWGGKLKFIGLRQGDRQDYSQLLTVDFPAGGVATGDRYVQKASQSETIARSEFRWKGGGADWQVSVEGALNALDVANTLFTRSGVGAFQPVPFLNAEAEVREKRAEAILSYGRPLSKTLSLQASGGAEYSRLSQSGPTGLTREFVRPKGQAALAWRPNPRTDLSLKIERVVGQLNFYDFVASGNLSAETASAGNANLVPPQAWGVEVQGTRNLGVWGTTTARAYVRFVTDIVDVVPIGATGQAPGNLDSARRYGVQWTSTINFDPLGWKGARLDADISLQRSQLTDPLTGEQRAINGAMQRSINVELRRDIPRTSWAYGASYDDYREAYSFRLDQRSRPLNSPGGLALFAENKDVFGLTVRGTVYGLLNTTERFTREFYNGRRTNGLSFTEDRARKYGLIFLANITGKF